MQVVPGDQDESSSESVVQFDNDGQPDEPKDDKGPEEIRTAAELSPAADTRREQTQALINLLKQGQGQG